MFPIYPYININDLNLDYLLRKIKELTKIVNDFVSLNTVKYANPIQWNITTQYEVNTVVVDPNDGTAYLSVKPVPIGVAITNTDYWTPIFTLDLLNSNQNISFRDDASNVLSTFTSAVGDWLIWNNKLYIVTRAINLNEAYVEGYNITRYSVELFIKDYVDALTNAIGDLTTLSTSDKTSIVNAINELVTNIGSLSALNTTDKTSVVSAINEVLAAVTAILPYDKADIRNYGGVADGTTDNVTAFNACMADNNMVYLPAVGTWYFGSVITLTAEQAVIGDPEHTRIKVNDGWFILQSGYQRIQNFFITCVSHTNPIITFDSALSGMTTVYIDNVYTYECGKVITDNGGAGTNYIVNALFTNCYFMKPQNTCIGGSHFKGQIYLYQVTADFTTNASDPNFPAFYFINGEGIIVHKCDIIGWGITTPNAASSANGFRFESCAATWVLDTMIDTWNGIGFGFNNCTYVYMHNDTVSLTASYEIYFEICNFVRLNGITIYGRKGLSYEGLANTSAINFDRVTKCVGNNLLITKAKRGGIETFGNTTAINLTNIHISDSTYGLIDAATAGYNVFDDVILSGIANPTYDYDILNTTSIISNIRRTSGAFERFAKPFVGDMRYDSGHMWYWNGTSWVQISAF